MRENGINTTASLTYVSGYHSPERATSNLTLRVTIAATLLLVVLPLRAEDNRRSTVGLAARIEQIVLPGSELEAKPLDDERAPIVLRIVAAFPHGSAFRYDIEYYGLEPGSFDLRDYLQRKDRSSIEELPSISVEIASVLPPGQIKPNPVAPKSSPYLGGYWLTIAIFGMVWFVGLGAIIWWICAEHSRNHARAAHSQQPLSLADRLRPIIQDAIAGKTNEGQLAELERMLLAFWRNRLELDNMNAADAIAVLREHQDAGALLEQLELWLHRPGSAREIDVAALLAPYRDLPADAMEAV